MEPSFNIRSQTNGNAALQLLAEAGPQGLSLICTDMQQRTVTDYTAYHFTEQLSPAGCTARLQEVLAADPLLQQAYQKITLVHAAAHAVLTPHEVYGSISGAEMLNGVFGDAGQHNVQSDFLYQQHLHTVYRIPAAQSRLFAEVWPAAVQWHQFSLLTGAFTGTGSQLYAVFYPHHLTVMLRSEGKLLAVQQFSFTAPETAAWHLLNVCACFQLPAADTELVLYGTIDTRSALYSELYKYFLHIRTAALPEGIQCAGAFDGVPPHYFAHLIAMQLCA